MSVELTSAAFGKTGTESVRQQDGPHPLMLDHPELTRRLDALFDEHFSRPRLPSTRVTVNHALKRVMDVVTAAVALALLWPVILISGIATLCDTGSPIFYSQIRRIRFGRRARIYKMRTMRQGADRKLDDLVNIKSNGRFLNVTKAESSYTRVGRVLERLWIVELPQLWSVLKGEMSLVGNRPIPDYVISVLGPTHEVAERFAGPQGLTGYTQIIGRENVTDDERIALEYHYSQVFEKGDVFIEDLKIIAITILTYLGIARRRCAGDFLGKATLPVSVTQATPAALTGGEPLGASATGVATSSETLEKLACPTCYKISQACDPHVCGHECVSSCRSLAIRVRDGRATIDDKCVACSACVHACPMDAIDKAPLTHTHEGLHCASCGTVYPENGGMFDLLPRRANLEQSPYFEFYESQYVDDNPSVHLEDTDWKLRELRPLLKRDMHYRSMLDLGCGAGVLGRTIASELNIRHAVSADWSTEILAVAREAAPQNVYIRVDAAYLPLRNRSYDLALMIDVIEHQHKPDQVLSELQRVADNLLLRTPLEDCWYESMRRRRKDLFRESSGHVIHYSPPSVRAQLAANGWKVRAQSVRHIAWTHWKRVLTGPFPLASRLTAAARYGLRWMLPMTVYRRLFVTNYNAFCTAAGSRSRASCTVSDTGSDEGGRRLSPEKSYKPARDSHPGRRTSSRSPVSVRTGGSHD